MHPGLRVSTQNLKETAVPVSDYLAMAQHYLLDFQNDSRGTPPGFGDCAHVNFI